MQVRAVAAIVAHQGQSTAHAICPGKGPSITLDFCSILKTVLARFVEEGKPFLGDRVHASQTFEAFLTEPAPRWVDAEPPVLDDLSIDVRRIAPDASAITTP